MLCSICIALADISPSRHSTSMLTSNDIFTLDGINLEKINKNVHDQVDTVPNHRRNMFSGALLTSGSFTMMASAGY
jgi:hypothetical protein